MHDVSGSGNDGDIGSKVKVGQSFGGGKGYQFVRFANEAQDAERLVLVRSWSLNPGDRDVDMSVRVQTWDGDEANIAQKGEAGSPGGFYKVEITKGKPGCFFKGSLAKREAWWTGTINDGKIHTITCAKRDNRVTISVDGQAPVTKWGRVGTISNNKPLSIGGKFGCNPDAGNECDYFVGKLGGLAITFG
jgi:hypothetical protein